MTKEPKLPGVVGETQAVSSRVPLVTERFLSPGVKDVAQSGPAGVITHDVRRGIADTGALDAADTGAEISQGTIEKLALLTGEPIALGTKYSLSFNVDKFTELADGQTPEAQLLRLVPIDVEIHGPNGKAASIGLPLDKAVAWQKTLTKEMKRFTLASVDMKLDDALAGAAADQRRVVMADVNPKMGTTDTAPFEAIRTFLPELPLAA